MLYAETRPSWDDATVICIYLLHSVFVLLLVCPFVEALCCGKNISQIHNKNKKNLCFQCREWIASFTNKGLILSTAPVKSIKYGLYHQILLFQKDASVIYTDKQAIHQTRKLHRTHCAGSGPTPFYS